MKIFLVEDEVLALRGLERKILDLDPGYEVVGTAANGAEALEAIPAARPDVVLTDIRMPDMDGLALIERLRERGSQVLPVIVSGYQEFEYAKQAVRLGVGDYLLKPVDPAELKTCLEGCERRLRMRRSRENVASILVGGDSISIEVPPGEDRFACAYLVTANALSDFEHVQHPNVPYLPSGEVEETLAPHFPAETRIRCMDGFFSNEKALIFSGPGLEEDALRQRLEQWCARLRTRTGSFSTLFYRTALTTPQKLESAIRACRRGVLEVMTLGQDVVTGRPGRSPVPDPRLGERAKLFTQLLRQDQAEGLRKNVKKMMAEWRSQRRTMAEISGDLVFLLNSLKQSLADRGEFPFSSLFFVENVLCFSLNEGELSENFSQLLWELFRPAQEERSLSGDELVDQIEAYFRANLGENISLQDLSDEMGLSKVYLCRVFKKQKDMTPIDYFNHMKIDRARELLVQYPDMPLREISDTLGFNDMYYFSKVFKRLTGIPPSEAREGRTAQPVG